jgi:hypothetical protein
MRDLHKLGIHRNHVCSAFPRLLKHPGNAFDRLLHRYRVHKHLVDIYPFHCISPFGDCEEGSIEPAAVTDSSLSAGGASLLKLARNSRSSRTKRDPQKQQRKHAVGNNSYIFGYCSPLGFFVRAFLGGVLWVESIAASLYRTRLVQTVQTALTQGFR